MYVTAVQRSLEASRALERCSLRHPYGRGQVHGRLSRPDVAGNFLAG